MIVLDKSRVNEAVAARALSLFLMHMFIGMTSSWGEPSAITCNQHHIKSVRSSKEEAVQNDGLPFLPISAHPPHYVARQLLRATGQFSHQSLSEQRACDMNRLAAMMVGTSTQ